VLAGNVVLRTCESLNPPLNIRPSGSRRTGKLKGSLAPRQIYRFGRGEYRWTGLVFEFMVGWRCWALGVSSGALFPKANRPLPFFPDPH